MKQKTREERNREVALLKYVNFSELGYKSFNDLVEKGILDVEVDEDSLEVVRIKQVGNPDNEDDFMELLVDLCFSFSMDRDLSMLDAEILGNMIKMFCKQYKDLYENGKIIKYDFRNPES